jgi:hypothetical protein
VFREVASGAKTDRAQLRRVLDQLDAGDVLMVTRLDRLARSARDLLNTLAAIAGKEAGFRSLGDAWADTTTPHGRLMLTVLVRWVGRVRARLDAARLGPLASFARAGADQARPQTQIEPITKSARRRQVSFLATPLD